LTLGSANLKERWLQLRTDVWFPSSLPPTMKFGPYFHFVMWTLGGGVAQCKETPQKQVQVICSTLTGCGSYPYRASFPHLLNWDDNTQHAGGAEGLNVNLKTHFTQQMAIYYLYYFYYFGGVSLYIWDAVTEYHRLGGILLENNIG
jgi:hypothetical protein